MRKWIETLVRILELFRYSLRPTVEILHVLVFTLLWISWRPRKFTNLDLELVVLGFWQTDCWAKLCLDLVLTFLHSLQSCLVFIGFLDVSYLHEGVFVVDAGVFNKHAPFKRCRFWRICVLTIGLTAWVIRVATKQVDPLHVVGEFTISIVAAVSLRNNLLQRKIHRCAQSIR